MAGDTKQKPHKAAYAHRMHFISISDKLRVLTMWSISFATMSKCSNTSPLMISLVKSTFQNRSTWRMMRFSDVSVNDNKNKHKICRKNTRKRDVLPNFLSILFRPQQFRYSYGWKYCAIIQNSIPGSEYELGSPLLNRPIFNQFFFCTNWNSRPNASIVSRQMIVKCHSAVTFCSMTQSLFGSISTAQKLRSWWTIETNGIFIFSFIITIWIIYKQITYLIYCILILCFVSLNQ